jgi:hypothetical protein
MVAVFGWFQMRMLDGLEIVDQAPSALLGVYFVVIAALTVIEIAVASILTAIGGGSAPKDERDIDIERRAGGVERLFVIAAVNVLIWQALMEGVFAGHDLPKIDLAHLPTLFFALFCVLFGGEIVRRTATIILYRSQAAHG